jgi:hypothetical protein
MPLEGHWERQQTPLRTMERRVLAGVAGAIAIAIAVVIIVAITGGASAAKAGCIEVTVPSTTGGASARACGKDAARYCDEQASVTGRDARATQEACRHAGF